MQKLLTTSLTYMDRDFQFPFRSLLLVMVKHRR